MITGQEIARALTGSWLLLKNRPEGMLWFDRSLEGFWRSFGVFFLLLPVFWIVGLADKKMYLEVLAEINGAAMESGTYWATNFIALALVWVAFPIVMAALAGHIGISRNYVSFIVVRNWTSMLAAVPELIAGLLYLFGIVPAGIMVLMSFAGKAVVLWYNFNIVRIALQTGLSLTIGIVVLDLLLSYFIWGLVLRIFG